MGWQGEELSGDPILLIGLRDKQRRLEGFRINVNQNLHDDLRRVAEDALARVRAMEAVPYTPYVGAEDGEYLSLATEALVLPKTSGGETTKGQDEAVETATLVSMIAQSDEAKEMGAGQLTERLDAGDFYLQAICLEGNDGRVGFVTKAQKTQVLERSRIPLGKDDQSDQLKRISRPELILETTAHAIVSSKEIAILNKTQFQFLVSDSTLIASHVPAQVAAINQAFTARGVAISGQTQAAILGKAAGSVRVAKRLDALAVRVGQLDISLLENGGGFSAQDLTPSDFLNDQGEIHCEAERVVELLDALEGRFFGDAFSAEKRRADNFRKR
ncbi:MAG: hypothetical protein ACOYD4_10035 [Solirubrobacterales bacterium]